jgi:hypothetical protein
MFNYAFKYKGTQTPSFILSFGMAFVWKDQTVVLVNKAFRRLSGLKKNINCHSKEENTHGSSQPSLFT